MTHALTDRIVFSGKRATGVLYLQGDKPQQVNAKREVLLCGGAIASLVVEVGLGSRSRVVGLALREPQGVVVVEFIGDDGACVEVAGVHLCEDVLVPGVDLLEYVSVGAPEARRRVGDEEAP